MKHTLKITILLITLFILTQVVGLATVSKYIDVEKTDKGIKIIHPDTILGPQPEVEDKSYSAIPIIIAVLIGTGILLLLIKFRLGKLWKLWFFLAVFMTLAVSFNVYIIRIYAIILALLLAAVKVLRPNIIVHNFTEIFVYTGITIVILPFLNIVSAITLLIVISLYDMYAVWKSKHMIKLAKFQAKSRLFAGLMLQYIPKKQIRTKNKKLKKIKIKAKSAMLGGGDIAFPLLFSAAVMEHLILNGLPKNIAFIQSSIITLFVAISLTILLLKSQKDKFYPAMPFVSIGCIIGYIIIILIS